MTLTPEPFQPNNAPPVVPGPWDQGTAQPIVDTDTPQKKKKWPWVLLAIFLALVFCLAGLVKIGGTTTPEKQSKAVAVAPTVQTTRDPTPAPATTEPEAEAPVTIKPTPPRKVSYGKLTARSWKLVAKNPDKYMGKTYVVYGVVTQFDSATDEVFRADVDGVKHSVAYAYETNTMLGSTNSDLSDLVEGDGFQANVIVAGSTSYETMMGGEMSVPLLNITSYKTFRVRDY